jgi:uncharacterized LabA/DUF88 family protein
MTKKIVRVCIFIDWGNIKDNFKIVKVPRKNYDKIWRIYCKIQEQTASILQQIDTSKRYTVFPRFYHGWHKNDVPTSERVDFEQVRQSRSLDRTIGSVYFRNELQFGNDLACGSPRNPLTSTSRPEGQKMVDTAITCDFLYLLKDGFIDIGLIASDDDDFLPAIFTAESWQLRGYQVRTEGCDASSATKNYQSVSLKFWNSQQ